MRDLLPVTSDLWSPQRDRGVDENVVLLRPRLGLVGFVDIHNRAFSDQMTRQDHNANETARTVGRRLREDRIRPGLVPRIAWAIVRRAPLRIDPNGAFDEAADAGALVAVQIGAAARRERHAVAAPNELAFGECGKRRCKLAARSGGGADQRAVARISRRKLEPPAGRAAAAGLDHGLALAVPHFPFGEVAALH